MRGGGEKKKRARPRLGIRVTNRIAGFLTVALAHHLQVDEDCLVDAHGVDLEGLLPLRRVLGTLDHLDLGCKEVR